MMDVVCAWCQKWLRKKEGPEDTTSHGMCEKCFDEISHDVNNAPTG